MANTSYHTSTVHRVKKTHFLLRQQCSVTCVGVGREEKHERGPGQWMNSTPCGRPEATQQKGDAGLWFRARWDCGPFPLQHPWSQLVASFRPINVPQTQKMRPGELEGCRMKTGVSSTDFSEDRVCRRKYLLSKKSVICVWCIYCLHTDATFKGYRNMYELHVWGM